MSKQKTKRVRKAWLRPELKRIKLAKTAGVAISGLN